MDEAPGWGHIGWRRDRGHARARGQYAIYNVYVPKPAAEPICVIEDLGNGTTAWNFASEAEAMLWVESLAGEVSVASGSCADQLAAMSCSTEYVPVHGGIDADGDACKTHSNACQFRTAVIAAAGQDGKARGQWSPGSC